MQRSETDFMCNFQFCQTEDHKQTNNVVIIIPPKYHFNDSLNGNPDCIHLSTFLQSFLSNTQGRRTETDQHNMIFINANLCI